jgi:hypothetical protein
MNYGRIPPPLEPCEDAMRYIVDAWNDALSQGVPQVQLAHSTLFLSLTDMVATYGEQAVAELTDTLANRIRSGEFTLSKSVQ